MERDNILKDKQEKMQSPIGGVDNDFQLGESKYSFYVILRRWAEKPLGFGRCGAVVEAMGFKKMGAVMYGRCAIKYSHGIDQDGWLLANEKSVLEKLGQNKAPGEGGSDRLIRMRDWIHRVEINGEWKPALCLEFIDGWTLQEICLNWPKSLWFLLDVIFIRWLIQFGEGLAYMHDNQVTHGDIKLHNCIVSRATLSLKIIDFGFSQASGRSFKPETDMEQLGKMMAQLIAQRSPSAYLAYQKDSSTQGCLNIVRIHGKSFWGFKTNLENLFEPGKMNARDFIEVMKECKERILKKQEVARKKAKLDGVDYIADLRKYLQGRSVANLLRDQTKSYKNEITQDQLRSRY